MRNNNQAIVRKIARKSLAANKGRNAFIMFAVFLTTFMLGTIISLSVSYTETQKAHEIRLRRTTAHVNLTNITENQIEKIKDLDYVSVCSYSVMAGSVGDKGYLNGNNVMLEYCEPAEWQNFRKPIISNIVGTYPQKIDEIMLPAWILENMGITEPVLGMEIPLVYQTDTEQLQTRTFKLSGYFTSYTLFNFGGTESIFVSQAFVNETGHNVAEYGRVQIKFVKNNPEEYSERLKNDAQLDLQKTGMNIYITNDKLDPIIYVYSVIAVFLVIVGFLLIYNVMSVSVSRDIRFYGLMKTIGMTPRQIRNMVLQQIMRLCAIAIPFGLLFSGLISFVGVPWFINSTTSDFMRTGGAAVSFNPFIFIGAAVFAFLTALLGAFNPAKKAADISPIEAVRFSEQGYSKRHVHSSKFNSLKVAWRNVFRVRKRAVLVFCSMFIGLTMFLLVMTILKSSDLDIYVESMSKNISGDISLKNRMPDYADFVDFENDNLQAFTPEFMERLSSLPGLYEMKTRYIYPIKIDLGVTDIQGNPHYQQGEAFGLNKDEIIKLHEEAGGSFDADAFERGEFIILKNARESEMEYTKIFFANDTESITLKIGGFISPVTSGGYSSSPEVYMSNRLLQELVSEPIIYTIDLFIEPAEQMQALSLIKDWTNTQQYIQWFSGIEIRLEVEQLMTTLTVMGGSISVILWLIGVINFINIITSSILSRKHEIALLESIGQSPKQSKKMLTMEGIIYAVITLFLVSVFGGALTYALISLLAKQYDYVVFSFPYIPLSIMVCVVLIVCLGVPRTTYRIISKMTLVERLREAE